MTHEAFIAADHYDLTLFSNWNGKGSKPKRYPRPTDTPPKRLGDVAGRTRDEVLAILAAHGHAPMNDTPPPGLPGRSRDARGRFVRRAV